MARPLALHRARKSIAVMALSAAVLSAALVPARQARAAVFFSGTCTMSLSISSSTPITKGLQFADLTYTGGGTCVTSATSKVVQSLQVFGTSGGNVSCSVLDQSGLFSFIFDMGSASSSATGIGAPSASVWAWPNGLGWTSVGVLAWSNAGQMTACLGGGTSTLSLAGVMIFQDPSL